MKAIIIGGSIAGMTMAFGLARQGFQVTILDADTIPQEETSLAAFNSWKRKGSPQVHHSHMFMARLRSMFAHELPDVYQELLQAGAREIRFTDHLPKSMDDPTPIPEDEELVMLGCQRLTFEWLLNKKIHQEANVEFRQGVKVDSLLSCRDGAQNRINGVKLTTQENLHADWVIDASGRRTKLSQWLTMLGLPPVREEREPSGVFSCTRFYKIKPGVEAPVSHGPIGDDLGYMKYGLYPGDGGIYSITLIPNFSDKPLRAMLRLPVFEAIVEKLDKTAKWVHPDVSEPISDLYTMGNLHNVQRWHVENGKPVALGVFSIGDALCQTNPMHGWGCSLVFISVFALRDALCNNPNDANAVAMQYFEACQKEISPWINTSILLDRDRVAIGDALIAGTDPYNYRNPDGTIDNRAHLRSMMNQGLNSASKESIYVVRKALRVMNLLSESESLPRDPIAMQKIHQAFKNKSVPLYPSREQILQLIKEQAVAIS